MTFTIAVKVMGLRDVTSFRLVGTNKHFTWSHSSNYTKSLPNTYKW